MPPSPYGVALVPCLPLDAFSCQQGKKRYRKGVPPALQVKMKGYEHDQLTVRLERPPHHRGRPPGPRGHIPRMGRRDSALCNPEIQIESHIPATFTSLPYPPRGREPMRSRPIRLVGPVGRQRMADRFRNRGMHERWMDVRNGRSLHSR